MFYVAVNIDYVISAVERAKSKKQIDSVKQHRLYGSGVGQGEEASRQQVISNMGSGIIYIYYTVTFSKGEYVLGESENMHMAILITSGQTVKE